MSTDSQTLLSQAKCYLCLGITIGEALQLALLAQIAGSGGTGGNAQLTSGIGAPTATPSTSPALYIDENTGTLYEYFAGAWH
jgi:hypothetical protein